MNTEELLEKLLERLDQQRTQVPLSDQLWDTEVIAGYLRRSYSTVRDAILVQPSFPKAIRLPGKGRSYPLYQATDVISWAKSFKG